MQNNPAKKEPRGNGNEKSSLKYEMINSICMTCSICITYCISMTTQNTK